jgi:transcriptional repressor NrdR
MKCPICGFIEDRVLETRLIGEGISIRRRRECISCGYRFTTYEHVEEKKLMVVKRDMRREEFSIEKLSAGINKAIEKRPVSRPDIEELLLTIEEEAIVRAGENHELSSHEIGEMVMKRLHALDQVAYIRFASVYRQFKDVKEFIKEIKNISTSKKKGGDDAGE